MLTPREQALAGYIYTIFDDPKIKAAGLSPTKFGRAVLACVTEDINHVAAFVLGKAVGPKAAQAGRNVAATGLGGVVSEKARGAVVDAVGTMIEDGFTWLGDKLEERSRKK
jgi:hypothetical protein